MRYSSDFPGSLPVSKRCTPLYCNDFKFLSQSYLDRRRQRNYSGKLRVLFIGRLDRQKGLDRLVRIIRKSDEFNLPIHWRLVGKNVIKCENAGNEFKSIENLIKPPALTTESLNELYEWADVLLLPYYWEGLPLTILEAMRLEVLICTSDVGAVREAIEQEKTGIILPNVMGNRFEEKVIAILQELIDNPKKLNRMSQAAAFKATHISWSRTILRAG